MKATRDGYTVGIALEPFDGENSTTTATIEVSPPAGGETSRTVKTGKILVFVNLGYSKLDSVITNLETASPSGDAVSKFWSVDQTTGKVNVNFFGDLNLQGNSIFDVKKITGYLGKWSIDEDGTLMAVKVITNELIAEKATIKEISAEKLCLDGVCVTKTQLEKLLLLVGDGGVAESVPEPPSALEFAPPDTVTSTNATSTDPM